MRLYLKSVANALIERNAEELIVGVFLALILSLASAGASALLRKKAKDTVALQAVLILVVNLGAMVFAAGYVEMSRVASGRAASGTLPVIPSRNRPSLVQVRDQAAHIVARRVFEAADTDGDGLLSESEAVAASKRFVDEVQADSGRPIDWHALGSAIRNRLKPSDFQPSHGRGPGEAPDLGPIDPASHPSAPRPPHSQISRVMPDL